MDFKIKIFADGADIKTIQKIEGLDHVKGFTTNPTLMRKAGVSSYENFAKELLVLVKNKPVSLEVFADDVDTIIKQAKTIAAWGNNVYVKIPVSDTKGQPMYSLIRQLSDEGISLNITAIMTTKQVKEVIEVLNKEVASIISVFAGRIADTGVDPLPIMKESLNLIKNSGKNIELLWASPRELLNIIQADEIGCDIITVDHSILNKLSLLGKDLMEFSRETVQMFYDDAQASGFYINSN